MDENGLPELPEAELRELEEAGAYYIDVGAPDPATRDPSGWAGHLVAIVGRPGAEVAVDLSIDQANRPEKSIRIDSPVTFPVSALFLRGREAVSWIRRDHVLFVYTAFPDDSSYEAREPGRNRA